jgi:F420-non-reducing hydrogenase iron-sulfur subunit
MTGEKESDEDVHPRILVFTTEKISDPGIDLAGLLKMHYPPSVYTISLPCSSAVKTRWILHAFRRGFAGVFVAADGTDCPYGSQCPDLTAKIITRSHEMMKKAGIDLTRLKMAAVCSVCAEAFANHMKTFYNHLTKLDSVKKEIGEQNE